MQKWGMRKNKACKVSWVPDETIGFLGQVRLVRKANGKSDLIGGSLEQRAFARNWCNEFAPFLEFVEPSIQNLMLAA